MPVVVRPQKFAGRIRGPVFKTSDGLTALATEWLNGYETYKYDKRTVPECVLLRHSFTDLDNPRPRNAPGVAPSIQGLVGCVRRAFQQDLHLILRPDDIWLAILVQFSAFVNGRSEELRGELVTHARKQILTVDARPKDIADMDLDWVAEQMTGQMRGYLKHPTDVDWLLPSFSTTTKADRGVAAMVTMSVMKSYFEYVLLPGCGFPSVTLLGEREDWVDLRAHLGGFKRFGEEATAWSVLLDKVVEYMVASFDRPEDADINEFWQRAVHQEGSSGSGSIGTISGWLTAFCYWTDKGERQYAYTDKILNEPERRRLVLDGVEFPMINTDGLPTGLCKAPVKAVYESGETVNTALVAGIAGMTVTTGTKKQGDSVQPRSGWWLFLDGGGEV